MQRALTPDDLRRHIATHDIDAQLVTDIGDTPTVPAAAEALGVSADRIVKTLLFLIRKPGQKEEMPLQPVLVISNGVRRVNKRSLADYFGVGKKRVKLAPPDTVLTLLGYPAGGVPPFGHTSNVPVLLDESVAALAGIVYGGGGDDRTMLRLTVAELVRVVQPDVLPLS